MTEEIVRFSRRVFAAVLIIGLLAAVAYSVQILLLIFAGILLAILFRSTGSWLSEQTHVPIHWCMAFVLLSFGTFFITLVWMFGSQIVGQADALFWAVQQAYHDFQAKLALYHMAGKLSTDGLNLEAPLRAAAPHALSLIASLSMVLFLGIYLSLGPQLYTGLFLSFFEGRLRGRVERLLEEMAAALRWWLAGQLIAMAMVGVITTTGLLIIGAPMAISLGIIAMLFTFVPYIGAIASAVPAILLALTQSGHMAMYVVLVYLIAHVLEGYIIVPLIQHRLVYLPPAMILATQFLAELFGGVAGVTLATPLMVVGMVLIKKLYFNQDWDEPAEDEAA